jgi:hypothetical protein
MKYSTSNSNNKNYLFTSTPPSTKTVSGQERRQLIDTLIAPIFEIGKDSGYEISENYDLDAGPVHVVWTIKPSSTESLPDIRLGFIVLQITMNLLLMKC